MRFNFNRVSLFEKDPILRCEFFVIYRFINYQVDAIRRTDPNAQVTAGAWSPYSVTDQFGARNLYKDECLRKAGGKQMVCIKSVYHTVHPAALMTGY